ncbi:hypothetical protein [Tsukamurella pseudospumae]|uniref:Uncharacterized protein n=1 Tax=Tsukamurella pseudospumae TaxID=239498 RepID=A0A138A0V2_9ACTN|nr:hypothetical protein [Tsukamurella pseudospumae]KXO88868.1 hypothetical protein AXK61_09435 [Tsukamurella pseudospumae]KXP04049.1 hypothetical protein AXK60_20125 [Tsukamurella pseudospumae]
METNSDAARSLADVDAVARKFRRIASPWWVSVAWAVNFGVFWSIAYGGTNGWRDIVIALGVFGIGTAVLFGEAKVRGARSTTYERGSWASGVSFWSMMAGLFTVQVVSIFLESGTWTTYVVLAGLSAVVYLLGQLLARYIAVRSER